MERQARSCVQTGATVVAPLPPIPPAIKRNTLLLAVTQAFVGVENQALVRPDGEHSALTPPCPPSPAPAGRSVGDTGSTRAG
jgi:hypothetical protein